MTTNDTIPYTKYVIAKKYCRYYLSSVNKHHIHSPFVYNFVTEVLEKSKVYKSNAIERERRKLKNSKQIIDFVDYGQDGKVYKRKVSALAKAALKPSKYARLIGKTVVKYNAQQVLELGTSLGITSSYIATNPHCHLTTLEGDLSSIKLAKKTWQNLGLQNITSIEGDFAESLGKLEHQKFDIIYIDGNHKYEPTISYFNTLLNNTHSKTLFIFDDIHYSPSMERAWQHIKESTKVSVTIDIFFLGFVAIDPCLSKQDFTIRF